MFTNFEQSVTMALEFNDEAFDGIVASSGSNAGNDSPTKGNLGKPGEFPDDLNPIKGDDHSGPFEVEMGGGPVEDNDSGGEHRSCRPLALPSRG